MLSLFPQIFFLEQIAPFILRLALGLIFISRGYSKIFNKESKFILGAGIIELAGGALVLAGFLTQLGALLIIADRILVISKTRQNYELSGALIAMAASLLFLGPGFLSIDLPL